MANLKDVIYLSNEDYDTLVTTGTVTISGTTLTYDENTVYITPEELATVSQDGLMSAADKSKLDTLPTFGTAASKNFTSTVTQNSGDLVTSGAVWTAIDNLPDPMIFKGTLGTGGTITTLPAASASNAGFTYKVITAGTYQSLVCKVGDVVVSNGTAWVLIPAGDTDSDTWRNIKVNGTELLGTAISTGAVNFKNGSNVTISGSGNDITISASQPTVNNGTLTIQGNGTAATTFTANQSGNSTLNIKGSGGTTVTKSADNEITISTGSIPTVNNATLTIQKNGTNVKTFTANASTDVTANITVPTKTSEITNDSGFLTSHQSIKTLKTDNTAAQSTSSSEAIAGSGTINLHKVAKTGTYSDLIGTPTIPTVNNATLTIQKNGTTVNTFTANASSNVTANITVPTKTSDLTNDSGFLTAESDTLGTVLNRGNTASKDIDLNDKDFFNAGTRKTAYIYSTSQDPQTQYYWFKITPPPSGASDRYYIAVENDVNYPRPRGNYILDISNYSSGTSYNISLNELAATGYNDTLHLLNVAADASGNVYVQAYAAWTSYLRFIRHNSNSTTQTYPSVGQAAFGTVAGFTSLKMISDTGCIRILNGANDTDANRTGHTQVHADVFIEGGTALSSKYLGKTSKAADADKLDGNDSTYFAAASSLNNYIPKSLTSTKGDIIYASAANTPARLGIGTIGSVLTVSSSGIPSWAKIAPMTSVIWNQLKAIRDTGNLIPGMQYRITDYQCTTTKTRTASASHQFDIIVVADSESKLNENARACLHSGDTYFSNSDLNAWRLKYCLDNDTTRFDWADSTNGKGVVYEMKDEFGNKCPYDFKNIQFTDANGRFTTSYTFNYIENSTYKDASLTESGHCYGNVIDEYVLTTGIYTLGYNVFYSGGTTTYWNNNHLKKGCYNNLLRQSCAQNDFDYGVHDITIGDGGMYNKFGVGSRNISLGSYSYGNTFAYSCYAITIGMSSSGNTFGPYCHDITFGDGLGSSTFNACSNIVGGRYMYYINIGQNCSYIKFGNASSTTDFHQNITIEPNCSYLYIAQSNLSYYIYNVHLHMGVKGPSSSNRRTITVPTDSNGSSYEKEFVMNNSTKIVLS